MKKDNNKKPKKSRIIIDILLSIMLVILIVLTALFIFKQQKEKNSEENVLAYTDLVKEIQAGNVEKIEMTVGTTTLKVKLKDIEKEKTTIMPSTQVFTELVQ